MAITHQDIVDRARELNGQWLKTYREAEAAAQAVVAKERESLQELCGGLGHVFKIADSAFALVPTTKRYCVFCSKPEGS